jgi:hypothetical protein
MCAMIDGTQVLKFLLGLSTLVIWCLFLTWFITSEKLRAALKKFVKYLLVGCAICFFVFWIVAACYGMGNWLFSVFGWGG